MVDIFDGTTELFHELVATKRGTMLVVFFADWCGPCRNLTTVLDQVSERNSDVFIIQVDVDKNEDIIKHSPYGLKSIPQFFFIKDGVISTSLLGMQTAENINSVLASFDGQV